MKVWIVTNIEHGFYSSIEARVLGIFTSLDLAHECAEVKRGLHPYSEIHEIELDTICDLYIA